MKLLSIIFLVATLVSTSHASETINLKPGTITSIALGEDVWIIGCDLDSVPDGVINLAIGSGMAISSGEESFSVSCN